MKHVITFIFTSMLLLSGCSKDDPTSNPLLPLPPSTEGTWVGTIPGALRMSLTITQNIAVISGSGSITNLQSGATLYADLSGSNSYPNVSISLGSKGYQPIKITGKFTNTATIIGELNESGFDHVPIGFLKQE